MNTKCLNEHDLVLMHYGETPEAVPPAAAAAHLNECASCRARREQLATALGRIPAEAEPDPLAATRIAARVSERLRTQRRWLPFAGGMAAATLALAMAIVVWMPANQTPSPVSPPAVAGGELPFVGPPRPAVHQAALDLGLLEQLDLLEELETLRDIEGV